MPRKTRSASIAKEAKWPSAWLGAATALERSLEVAKHRWLHEVHDVATGLTHSHTLLAGERGMLVPFNDSDALAEALISLLADEPMRARVILFSWLAGNLLLGSQFVWNLRPFIGAPFLPVEFFRPNAFEGSFFEAVTFAARQIFSR